VFGSLQLRGGKRGKEKDRILAVCPVFEGKKKKGGGLRDPSPVMSDIYGKKREGDACPHPVNYC